MSYKQLVCALLRCPIYLAEIVNGSYVGFSFFQKIMTYLFDFPHGPKVLFVIQQTVDLAVMNAFNILEY